MSESGVRVGVGHFERSESEILERSDILPPTAQPWFLQVSSSFADTAIAMFDYSPRTK